MITTKRRVNEAFAIHKRELGEVPFKTSTVADRHIQQIVNMAAARTGVPANDILAKIGQDVAKIEQLKQYSPFLYETIAKNAVEQAAFDLIDESDKIGDVKFDPVIFS